jgi:putative SOS response-associated peptidase YedK
MCGRYRRTTKEEELARLYRIPIPPQLNLPISYNIAPSQNMLVIRFNPKRAQRSLDALRWGLIPYWTKDPKIGTERSTREWSRSTPRPRIGKLSRDAGA